jgi:Cu-Zn family superoxide dismutase
MRRILIGNAVALALAACATAGDGGGGPAASAELRDSAGLSKGRAMLRVKNGGVWLRVKASGLAPGVHGIHIHAVGRCDPPDFASAGAHWNPAGRQHGRDNPQGMHQGDLPNLTVGATGRDWIEVPVAGATSTAGLLDADGASIVIHAAPDDYRTDPSGNSGARIACGVLAAG